jgi:hypothetical protein
MFGSRGWVAQDAEKALAHGEVETDHQGEGRPMTVYAGQAAKDDEQTNFECCWFAV